MIVEYNEKYNEQIKELLIELQNYLIDIDDWHTQVMVPEYKEKYFELDMEKVKMQNGKIFLSIEDELVNGLIVGVVETVDEVDKLTNDCAKTGEVLELIVSKKNRGNGVGKILLNKMEEYFKNIGCIRTNIEVFGPNVSGLNFYEENGYVVKMIGRAERNGDVVSSSVMPMFVKKDDVFASIPLNFNAIASNSKTLGKAVYIGQGAGSLPTAHAVVQDIIDIEKSQSMEMQFEDGMINNENVKGIYYIRSKNMEVFQDIMDGEVTKKVRLLEVLDRMKKANDKEAFIAEVEA